MVESSPRAQRGRTGTSPPAEPPPWWFDCRSAGQRRTTGWERYAREISQRIAPDPRVRLAPSSSTGKVRLVASDWLSAPVAARRADVAHFPTFPPTPPSAAKHTTVYTLHDLVWWRWPETASRLGRSYYRPLAEAAVRRCHVVVPSQSIADEVKAHFGVDEARVSVVYPGADLPAGATKRPASAAARPYLLTVATLEPRKNLDRLAAGYLASGLQNEIDLVVVGRRAWGEPPAGVQVRSDVDDVTLAALYAGAHAVVLPSLYEGFGLPLVEALSAGTRVAASDLPVFREVTGGHATFFDPYDADAIAEALQAVVELPAGCGPEATGWANRFTWDRTASELIALYERLSQP